MTAVPLDRAAVLAVASRAPERSDALDAFIAERCEPGHPGFWGSSRIAYPVRDASLVLKVPRIAAEGGWGDGRVANLCEAAVWQHRWRGMPRTRYSGRVVLREGWQRHLCPTRLVWIDGVPCVLQWRLTGCCRLDEDDYAGHAPRAVPRTDGTQVGLDARGVLRVYDFEFLFPYALGRGRAGWMRDT